MFQLLQGHIQPAGHRSRKNRLVTKDGHCNIGFGNIEYSNHFAYVVDLWTTFVEIRWRFVLLLFVASFTGSWFIFSLLCVRVTTPHCVHCFETDADKRNPNGHNQQKMGIDNLGFQAIDIHDSMDITKM
ncbi:hypothetical protein Q8A73_022463 [Channa argus]|nr:hypothetical protein Q8A73_022463 [Channa argus]